MIINFVVNIFLTYGLNIAQTNLVYIVLLYFTEKMFINMLRIAISFYHLSKVFFVKTYRLCIMEKITNMNKRMTLKFSQVSICNNLQQHALRFLYGVFTMYLWSNIVYVSLFSLINKNLFVTRHSFIYFVTCNFFVI